MDNISPFLAIQDVERQIKALLRILDMDMLDTEQRKATQALKRLAIDARIDIRDYELSETREEQLGKAKDAKKQLAKLNRAILAVGLVFGPADVAQLSATIEHINGRLI